MSNIAAVNPVPLRSHRRFTVRLTVFLVLVLGAVLGAIYLIAGFKDVDRRRDERGEYSVVDLKSLGFFELDVFRGKLDDIPAKWRALDGQRVLLTGQWYPIDEQGPAFTRFQLVYSITNCCFNGPPRAQERVFVFLPRGVSAELPGGGALINVLGTLKVQIKRDATGKISGVYTMDAERITPA
jgi:hypothetical protein